MSQQRWPSSEEKLEEYLQKAKDFFNRLGPLAYVGVAAVLVVLWLATGLYMVGPGEQGVERRFGKHVATTDPGLNYRLPWPIMTADAVDVSSIRRTEIGFRSMPQGRSQPILAESLMLTKDENIVDVQVIVQYRIKDPAEYLFKVQDPENVLTTSVEVALRSTVGRMYIDEVITERRAEVQAETKLFLERLLDIYKTGIHVTDVRLQVADAPLQVRDAFHEVVRAREDRERLVNEAEAYMEDILPRARGVGRRIEEESVAYREERVRRSRGDASRFIQVLAEYQQAPEVTRERLHIEAMERVLASAPKVLIGNNDAAKGVLPLLPLRGLETLAKPDGTTR